MDTSILKKVNNFFSPYNETVYKKGEILIRAFENPNNIYYLSSGIVKMYSVSKNGKEYTLNIFKPISFFPMSLALNQEENYYYYEAATKVTVKKAGQEKVISFIKENPDVMFDLLKRLYKGIDGLLIKMDFAMTSDAKSRIIVELIILAKRFGIKKNDNYEINISISNLATNTGLARETVSRQIKILKQKRLIFIKEKKLIIFNLGKLAEELGQG